MQNFVISSSILASALAVIHSNGNILSPRELLQLHGAKSPKHHRVLTPAMFHNMTFDSEEDNRDLKVRNNFWAFSWYVNNDMTCEMTPSDVHGFLVNYCFNTAPDASFLLKVNKKQNLYVELDYNNDNCQGVPSSIFDMNWYDFGVCGDAGYPGCYVKYEYLTDYPSPMYTGMNQYTSEMSLCDSGNFNTFNWYTSGVCGVWTKYNLKVTDCDSEGGAVFNRYESSDLDCNGAIIKSIPKTAETCSTTALDDEYLFTQENTVSSAMCQIVLM